MLPIEVGELRATLAEPQSADSFAVLPRNTHFMAGAKSAAYFRSTARKLHQVVPGSTFLEMTKGIHGSVPAAFAALLDDTGDHVAALQHRGETASVAPAHAWKGATEAFLTTRS